MPTLPLALRNRVADAILEAVHDERGRRQLAALGAASAAAEAWLGGDARHAASVREWTRRASEALSDLAPLGRGESMSAALEAAARLFDAGLAFEVHEMLEPHWARALGAERDALQGLIQIAVGYQHLANGNVAGARALLEEGTRRIDGRRLRGVDLATFAAAVRRALDALVAGAAAPRFPRGFRDG